MGGRRASPSRSGVAGAVLDGRLLVMGGEGNDDDPDGVFVEVEAYDPVAGGWDLLPPTPTPRHGIGAALVDGEVYVPGGGPVEGFGVTGVHEVLVPEPEPGLLAGAAWGVASLLARSLRRRRSPAPSAPPCRPS